MLTACQLLCLGQCVYIAVGFWRSLNGHTVNSGYCTCMLSWSHQWQVRHTARHHTTQGPWPFLQSYSSPWANSQGPVLPGPNSWGLFSITVVLPFIGFHINGLVQCVIFRAWLLSLFYLWDLVMSSRVSSGSLLTAVSVRVLLLWPNPMSTATL